MPESKAKTVLMVDDDSEDCMLATEAFAKSGADAAFSCVMDGVELMEYLAQSSGSRSKQLPDLILLDLNMPRKDGRKVLVEMKAEQAYKHIPIVVLTTSGEEKDVEFMMKAGAESFLTKPATFDEWVDIMKSLASAWLTK